MQRLGSRHLVLVCNASCYWFSLYFLNNVIVDARSVLCFKHWFRGEPEKFTQTERRQGNRTEAYQGHVDSSSETETFPGHSDRFLSQSNSPVALRDLKSLKLFLLITV